jgi:ArsR family metal-binding transcriptional regulator
MSESKPVTNPALEELLRPDSYFTKENNIFINDLNRIVTEYDSTFSDVKKTKQLVEETIAFKLEVCEHRQEQIVAE